MFTIPVAAVIEYGYMHKGLLVNEQKHATIVDVSDELLENIFDSNRLKIEFISESGKKVTTKFSLKGASSAIESAIARCNEHRSQTSTWHLSTSY